MKRWPILALMLAMGCGPSYRNACEAQTAHYNQCQCEAGQTSFCDKDPYTGMVCEPGGPVEHLAQCMATCPCELLFSRQYRCDAGNVCQPLSSAPLSVEPLGDKPRAPDEQVNPYR